MRWCVGGFEVGVSWFALGRFAAPGRGPQGGPAGLDLRGALSGRPCHHQGSGLGGWGRGREIFFLGGGVRGLVSWLVRILLGFPSFSLSSKKVTFCKGAGP